MRLFKFAPVSCLLFIVLFSCTRDADSVLFTKKGLPMDAGQLVPANTNTASGTIDVVYNQTLHTLSYTISFTGLSGKPTSIRVHGPATKGSNAAPVQVLSSGLPSTETGTYSNSLFVDRVFIREDNLLRGAYYITIYTAANPTAGPGEIRGQLLFE